MIVTFGVHDSDCGYLTHFTNYLYDGPKAKEII